MSPMLLMFGTFFLMLIIGATIVVALGVSALSIYLVNGEDFPSMIVLAYNAVDSFPIMALPSVVLVACCLIGFSTPPLGENMFIASSIAKVSLEQISWQALPCVLVMLVIVVVIAVFPDLSLFLPRLSGF